MIENLTFENLPTQVSKLSLKLDNIEKLLLQQTDKPTEPQDKFLTIQQASKFLNLTVPTIYSKVSRRQIPFMKRGKRLYFSQLELIDYVKSGRIKTNAEIEAEAESYLSDKKKGLNNG